MSTPNLASLFGSKVEVHKYCGNLSYIHAEVSLLQDTEFIKIRLGLSIQEGALWRDNCKVAKWWLGKMHFYKLLLKWQL